MQRHQERLGRNLKRMRGDHEEVGVPRAASRSFRAALSTELRMLNRLLARGTFMDSSEFPRRHSVTSSCGAGMVLKTLSAAAEGEIGSNGSSPGLFQLLGPALHCTALHCTALHCTALHCTALHCTALHCTALLCTALHCTALHCTALHCTALHCTAPLFFHFLK